MDEVRGWWVLVHFWPMTRGLDHPVKDDRLGRRPPAVASQGLDPSDMISWRPFQNPSACPEQDLHSSCSCCVFVSEIRRASSLLFSFGGDCFCELTDRARNATLPIKRCKWRHWRPWQCCQEPVTWVESSTSCKKEKVSGFHSFVSSFFLTLISTFCFSLYPRFCCVQRTASASFNTLLCRFIFAWPREYRRMLHCE